MFCKKCLFLFKDVVCPAGKSNSQVAVEAGDTIGDQWDPDWVGIFGMERLTKDITRAVDQYY